MNSKSQINHEVNTIDILSKTNTYVVTLRVSYELWNNPILPDLGLFAKLLLLEYYNHRLW